MVFQVTGGPGVISGGNRLGFTGAGEVVVTASQAGGANHLAAPEVSRTVTVTKAPATVTLSGLSQVYNGTARIPVATTDPAGTHRGLHLRRASGCPGQRGELCGGRDIDEARYSGTANGTLEVAKAAQTIEFAALADRLATDVVNLGVTGGGSGNPVVFSVEGPAQLAANVLSFTGPERFR